MALHTARLVLRPRAPEDRDAYLALASHWDVVRRTASWPWPPDPGFVAEWLARGQPEEGLVASILEDGRVIGMGCVVGGELGYMLAPQAWGRGYATEACAALVSHAFVTTGWPEVVARAAAGNEASLKVLAKLGFAATGAGPSWCRATGRDVQCVTLALTRDAWNGRPCPAPAA